MGVGMMNSNASNNINTNNNNNISRAKPNAGVTLPHIPGKTRKRHKVATSCNRCRQNKRKCDSGVPCSNCQRNKADCIYTDAQLSRSTWGDSPLSKEKILGVSSAGSGNTSVEPQGPSSTSKPLGATTTKKASAPTQRKSTGRMPIQRETASGPQYFSPGHASVQADADQLDYRKQALNGQSRQIAKAIRIANPGPNHDRARALGGNPTNANLNIILNTNNNLQHSNTDTSNHHNSNTSGNNDSHLSTAELTAHVKFEPNMTPNLWPRENHDVDSDQLASPNQSMFPDRSHNNNNNSNNGLFPSGAGERGGRYLDPRTSSYDLTNSGQQRSTYNELPSFDQRATNMLPQGYGPNSQSGLGFSNVSQSHSTSQQPAQQQMMMTPTPNRQSYLTSSQPLQQQHQQQEEFPISHDHLSVSRLPVSNHAISSAAPVSALGISAQYPPTSESWFPSSGADQASSSTNWRDSNNSTLPNHGDQYTPSYSLQPHEHQATPHLFSQPTQPGLGLPLPAQKVGPVKTEERSEKERMQKIAKEMLDCRQYDYSIMLPRHISQEEDELWATPQSSSQSDLRGIPRQLLMLPKDANYLVDVFFENACFYCPAINRATVELHLLEPQNPHSLFLLNLVFMTACKHLARRNDIKRAIQFRDRAKEIQHYITGRVRLSKMQANILGSQAVYGVFPLILGMAQCCGTYKIMPTTDEALDGRQSLLDLEAESRSVKAKKGTIPDAVYQQRLWTFWGFYVRDSMSRLYFGWPHGLDTMAVTAELPRIKGSIGLGGMRKTPLNADGLEVAVTGKRRGVTTKAERLRHEKKLMKAKTVALQVERNTYRRAASHSDDDDDDDDDDDPNVNASDSSDDEIGDADAGMEDEPDQHPHRHKVNLFGTQDPSVQQNDDLAATKEMLPSFTSLSMSLLQRQGKGEDISKKPSGSSSQSPEAKRHLERMRMLLEAEDDVTDGGTYARVLFLEEVKLWSIGRRVGLYLQSKGDSSQAGGYSTQSDTASQSNSGSGKDSSRSPFGPSISTTVEASRCSERVWLEDNELQGLQADLIAWEQGLPPNLRFRKEVDDPDVNHKINGRLGIMTMYYYTITIMLQSSYLPIPQYLKSPGRTYKSPETLTQEYDGLFSRGSSLAFSEDQDGPRVKFESDDYYYSGRSQPRSSAEGYFNTAHQICTQLSNVLYHHVELLLDSYPNWCGIQHKLNQTLTAALRVSCLNARLGSNPKVIRDEAKAGFKMGSDLFKRQALLPEPLTVRDWPAEEDVQVMLDLEEEFRELVTIQEEEQAMVASLMSDSQNPTRANSHELFGEESDLPLFDQYGGALEDQHLLGQQLQLQQQQNSYDIFPAVHDHVFGLGDEGFQFEYNMDA
ncbi:hypothetical protein BGZ83_011094 [Gryganskiella cystojenkinii]|nr:hypothetical protein BGZ83_011094 [Gryganskiella cystojenkinii]